MATNKTMEIWNGLPTWAKGVIAVGGIAIIYFTGKTIYKKIQGAIIDKPQKQTVKDTKAEIREVQQTGEKQSYSESQYKSWADSIQKAFDGCDPLETSQNTVNRVVRELKNNLDWLKLVDAYGVRTYDQCGLWSGDFTGNLYAAIEDELDGTEKAYVNKLLSERGITYRV